MRISLLLVTATNALVLSRPPDATGYRLQAQTNPVEIGLTTNWINVPAAPNPFIIPALLTNASVFYRFKSI